MSEITATSIPVGSSIQGLAVNPVTNLVYAADYNNAVVKVLDAANDYNVVDSIAVGMQPYSVAVDQANNIIYVVNQNITGPQNILGTLSIIDGATAKVTSTLNLPDIPIQVVVNQSTGDAYTGGSNVTRIANGAIAKSIPVGPSAVTGICVSAESEVAFIYLGPHFQFWLARATADTLTPIDQTVVVPLNANGIGANVDTHIIYTTALQAGVVQSWDGRNSPPTVVSTTTTGGYPERVAVNLATQNYYTCNYWNSTVTIVSPTNPRPTNVSLGHQPWIIDVNPSTNIVYTGNYDGTMSYFTDTSGS
jgi:DNA-binding beta-propeller fold protein YncE